MSQQIDLPQNMFFDDLDEQDNLLVLRCRKCNLAAHFSPEFTATSLIQTIQAHICGKETEGWHT